MRETVFVPREELERAQKKLDAIFAIEFPVFILDPARERGYVIWTAHWKGGTLKLKKVQGERNVERSSEWIT